MPNQEAEYVLVIGGPRHGERVRWIGLEMIVPVLKSVPIPYTPISEAPKAAEVGYTLIRYITWQNEQTGDKCYIEESEAKRIQEQRGRKCLLEQLEARLGKHVPNPGDILRKTYLRGEVWECGDEYCECSQARIYGWDSVVGGWRHGMTVVWEGPFYTDNEPGASKDLHACHVWLQTVAPSVDAQIEWPDGVVSNVW